MSDNTSKLIIKKDLIKKKNKGLINKQKNNNKIIESRNDLFNYYKKKFLTDKLNGNIPINRVFNQAPNSFTKYSEVINDLEKNNNITNKKNCSYRNIYQFPTECNICCCNQCCYPKFCCCGCHSICNYDNTNNNVNNSYNRNNCNNTGFSYLGGLSTQISSRNCSNTDYINYKDKYLERFLTNNY
jgi:hypothetical protein